MYVPSHFAESDTERLHEFIRAHPLGTLVTLTPNGLNADHVPFLIKSDPTPHGTLRAHVARANTVWREHVAGTQVLVIFHGADSFVSPSWYPSKRETGKVVPTWNYVVVHAHGSPTFIDDRGWLRAHVEALTNEHEAHRAPPWAVRDAPSDFVENLLAGIVGIEIPISRLTGKWKLSQNRTAADREGVVRGLSATGTPAADAVADLVRETLRGREG